MGAKFSTKFSRRVPSSHYTKGYSTKFKYRYLHGCTHTLNVNLVLSADATQISTGSAGLFHPTACSTGATVFPPQSTVSIQLPPPSLVSADRKVARPRTIARAPPHSEAGPHNSSILPFARARGPHDNSTRARLARSHRSGAAITGRS